MANFKLTQTGEQIQADLNLLDSNSATQGQVLTADGAGGASWQEPSGGGGGTQLYTHNLNLLLDSSNFIIISTRSSAITTFSDLYNEKPLVVYFVISSNEISTCAFKLNNGKKDGSIIFYYRHNYNLLEKEYMLTAVINDTVTPL